MNYQQKYLKYKKKYLELKGGAMQNPIPDYLKDVLAQYDLNNKHSVLGAIKGKKFGGIIQYVSPQLRADKDVIMAAVSDDGSLLGYASEELRGDKQVVMTAIKNTSHVRNLTSFKYISGEAKLDTEIILTYMSLIGPQVGHHLPQRIQVIINDLRSGGQSQPDLKDDRYFYMKIGESLLQPMKFVTLSGELFTINYVFNRGLLYDIMLQLCRKYPDDFNTEFTITHDGEPLTYSNLMRKFINDPSIEFLINYNEDGDVFPPQMKFILMGGDLFTINYVNYMDAKRLYDIKLQLYKTSPDDFNTEFTITHDGEPLTYSNLMRKFNNDPDIKFEIFDNEDSGVFPPQMKFVLLSGDLFTINYVNYMDAKWLNDIKLQLNRQYPDIFNTDFTITDGEKPISYSNLMRKFINDPSIEFLIVYNEDGGVFPIPEHPNRTTSLQLPNSSKYTLPRRSPSLQ